MTVTRAPTTRPLTARSVVLSTLLGYHPPELPVRTLVRIGGLFDIAERTVRVALVRMVADGELTATDGVYRLHGRLIERQRRQQEDVSPRVRHARGAWQLAIVTATARPLAERTALRRAMSAHRLAELREGVWLRPANLTGPLAVEILGACTLLTSRPDEPSVLAATLWDLDAWALRARELLVLLASEPDLRAGFLASAGVLRHLQADPVLPADLLPPAWPGGTLRDAYTAFEADYAARLRSYGDA